MVFSFVNNILKINDKQKEFLFNIGMAKEVSNLVIIQLQIPPNIKYINNIFGINANCEIVWRIQDLTEVFPFSNDVPFEGFKVNEEGNLQVVNFYGAAYIVNPINGKIIGHNS